MKDKQLQELLARQQYDFGAQFTEQVMSAVGRVSEPVIRHLHWFLSGVAACLLICASIVYLEHGQLSYDAFLGIDSLYNDTLNEISFYL